MTRRLVRAGARRAAARYRVVRRAWKTAYTGGGREEVARLHNERRALERAGKVRTAMATNLADELVQVGAMLPEGAAMAKASQAIGRWVPENAMDVHMQLSTIARVVAHLGSNILDYAETLAAMRCDPRIVGPLIGVATSLGADSHAVSIAHRNFLRLYAGDITQSESPARPMTYPASAK